MQSDDFSKIALVTAGVAAFAVAVTAGSLSNSDTLSRPSFADAGKKEKCYGIVARGANDCQTAAHSCAAQARTDRDPGEWVYVEAGLCERLAGGKTEPT